MYKLDDLFICYECDADGVPELMRSSGKHTEEHHLIRCLAPVEGEDDVTETDQRLKSIETRLDGMQARFDDLTTRIGNIEELLRRLAETASSGSGAKKL